MTLQYTGTWMRDFMLYSDTHPFKWLSYHCDLVLLVWRLCKALKGGSLNHSLTERHHWVGHLHLDVCVQLAQILQEGDKMICTASTVKSLLV